jgi:hypothetical protein
MPEGRMVSNGRVFVASSPLENIATALQRGMGMHQAQGVMGQQQGLINQEQQYRTPIVNYILGQAKQQALIDAIRGRQQQPTQQGAPPWVPPVGTGTI